jgi:hypothetical protein
LNLRQLARKLNERKTFYAIGTINKLKLQWLEFVLGGIVTKPCMQEPLTAKAVILGEYERNRQVRH